MFGTVPKTLWERWLAPDDKNRIPMVARSLVIAGPSGKMLVDVGCGDEWDDKAREIFQFETINHVVENITDVLLTHLHFDHAGGLVLADGTPAYPEARHYVSRRNLDNAISPNRRERASYLRDRFGVLEQVDRQLTENGDEVWPGVSVHQAHGHTHGLQWVKVTDDGATVAFPSDLCPTSHHLPVPYVMGYDMCAETAMEEKEAFVQRAVEGDWTVVFQHDPVVAVAKVSVDERGRPYPVPVS